MIKKFDNEIVNWQHPSDVISDINEMYFSCNRKNFFYIAMLIFYAKNKALEQFLNILERIH